MTLLLAEAHATGAVPDPSWILSTCAAAAATLLAIVGGFVVAQLIALVSDQHAADARLTDARAARDDAQADLARATDALRAAATRALLSDRVLAGLVAVRGAVLADEAERYATPTALLAALPAVDREQSIARAVQIMADQRKRAIDALICLVPVSENPESWDEFKLQHFLISADDEAQWHAVYNLIAAQRAIEAAEQMRPAGAARSVAGEIEYHLKDTADAPFGSPVNGSRETEDVREVLTAWRQAVRDSRTTAAAADAALLRRKELIPLNEFGFGVGVLAYLAAAVMLPLIVLATGPRSFSVFSRYLVPSVLGIGVILLILFFTYLSGRARRPAISLPSRSHADPEQAVQRHF